MPDAHSTAEEVTEGLDLTGQAWLVTGCNSGLGRETIRVLALRGAHVVGLARTRAKAEDALASLDVDGSPVACELSDLGSVASAVRAVQALGRPLDGIVTNAGIMALPRLEQVRGYERQFFTNHIGHFALVLPLLPLVPTRGRVVVLSSGAHRMARERGLELDNLSGEQDYDPWRMYARSKLANILFARGLAARFAGDGSKRTANAVHPGIIATNLQRHLPDTEGLMARMKDRLKTVAQGAATSCYVATRPELAGVRGRYFADCDQTAPIPAALDDTLAEALWTRSEQIVAEAS